jgi:adenylate cyclase
MSTRRLAAILAADVVGYSRLMGADEEGTLGRLKAVRRELIDPKIAEHRGRIVKTTGDGILVEFASAVDAARCAVEVQRAMTERGAGMEPNKRIEIRIGIHVGDIIIDGDDIFGDGVNIAARLEGVAEPGGITISGAAHEQVRDRLPYAFEDGGEQSMKNIARPVRVYRVRADGSASVSPIARPPTADVPLTLPDKPSIAVLPFQNMSGDPEQEYFADGVAEDIITELSRYRSLFVIARNSTFTYKGKAVDVRQVSRELGVQYVLEGSIRKAGNRVRVTAQLVDALTGNHLWAQRFDRMLDDIFAVQEEITRSIVSAVGREVEEARLAALSRTRPINLGAYEIGLRAWAQIRDLKLRPVDADPNAASAMAEQALAIDDRCVPALVALAQAHWHHGFYRTSPSPSASLDMAIDVASRAQDVDHWDHRPHLIKGLALLAAGRHDDALFEAQRAHELNPNDPATLGVIGAIEARSGQTASGIERLMQALRIDPLNPYQYVTHLQLAVACFLARNYAKGVEWAVLCKRAAPDLVMNLNILTVNYVGLGRIDEARKEFEVANRLAPELLKQRLATGSPMFKLQEDRQRDAQFLRVAAGLEDAPR